MSWLESPKSTSNSSLLSSLGELAPTTAGSIPPAGAKRNPGAAAAAAHPHPSHRPNEASFAPSSKREPAAGPSPAREAPAQPVVASPAGQFQAAHHVPVAAHLHHPYGAYVSPLPSSARHPSPPRPGQPHPGDFPAGVGHPTLGQEQTAAAWAHVVRSQGLDNGTGIMRLEHDAAPAPALLTPGSSRSQPQQTVTVCVPVLRPVPPSPGWGGGGGGGVVAPSPTASPGFAPALHSNPMALYPLQEGSTVVQLMPISASPLHQYQHQQPLSPLPLFNTLDLTTTSRLMQVFETEKVSSPRTLSRARAPPHSPTATVTPYRGKAKTTQHATTRPRRENTGGACV